MVGDKFVLLIKPEVIPKNVVPLELRGLAFSVKDFVSKGTCTGTGCWKMLFFWEGFLSNLIELFEKN